jgi:anti-anti-sigma factor
LSTQLLGAEHARQLETNVDGPNTAGLADGDAGKGKLIVFTSAKSRQARVSLVGELDVTTAQCLTSWAERFTAATPRRAVRLDASGLRFADVCGIRALTRACQLLQRCCRSFELAGLSEPARRAAELTGSELATMEMAAVTHRTVGSPVGSAWS